MNRYTDGVFVNISVLQLREFKMLFIQFGCSIFNL